MHIFRAEKKAENPPQKTIKVLQIISGDLWAGAEAMAYQLLSGISKEKNIDLFVLLLNQGKLLQKCYLEGIKTYLINEDTNSFLKIFYKSIKLSIKIKPDIIHAHRYKENVLASMIQPFCGMPILISTQHGRIETEGKSSYVQRLKRTVSYACLNWRFNSIVAVSNDTRNFLLMQQKVNEKHIKCIPNGINFNHYSSTKKNIHTGNIRIGSAGRLFPVKNYLQMVDIAKQVCEYRDNVEFLLAGDGPEEDAIKDRIICCGIEKHFKLLGHLNDMKTFYKDIDIYVNMSLHEGSPMTILEAMASGKPVLAFHQAGLKEIITNGFDGYTVPEKDINLYVSKIIQLIDDPEMIVKMGKDARKKIENKYDSKQMTRKYISLYQEMIKI